ncbi:unnamed protein product [Scytosiphon promiscuus]
MGTMSVDSGRMGSWRRLMLGILGHPWFNTTIWWIFMTMSLIMLAHNLLLRSWGIGTFASETARLERQGEEGMFNSGPLVDAEGKPSFLQYARMPAGRFMHILPAGLWSVIAPLQISPSFRAKHRTAHCRLGRLFMFMSVSIALGVVPIVRSGASKFGHSVFEGTVVLACALYFLVVGLIAVRQARNRKFASHRVWMLRHVAMGYSVHMQRLLGILSWWVFPHIIPGYSDHSEEGSRKRTIVFGAYFAVGVLIMTGTMEVWLRYTSPSGKVMKVGEEEQKATRVKAD